jgi:hypothetical protein
MWTYNIFPVDAEGRVLDNKHPTPAGYSAASQAQARAECLRQFPEAAGTARAWVGEDILTHRRAGEDLDAAEWRP